MDAVAEHIPDPANVIKDPIPIPANKGSKIRFTEMPAAKQMEQKIGYSIIRDAEPLHTDDIIHPDTIATTCRLLSPFPVMLTILRPSHPANPVWNIPPPTIIIPIIRMMELDV